MQNDNRILALQYGSCGGVLAIIDKSLCISNTKKNRFVHCCFSEENVMKNDNHSVAITVTTI